MHATITNKYILIILVRVRRNLEWIPVTSIVQKRFWVLDNDIMLVLPPHQTLVKLNGHLSSEAGKKFGLVWDSYASFIIIGLPAVFHNPKLYQNVLDKIRSKCDKCHCNLFSKTDLFKRTKEQTSNRSIEPCKSHFLPATEVATFNLKSVSVKDWQKWYFAWHSASLY